MSTTEIRFFEMLKDRIGDQAAEAFVEILDRRVDAKFEAKKDVLATKEDIHALRIATKEEIAALRLASKEDISAVRAELLRAIYLTNIGQLLAIVAAVIGLILALKK